MWLAEDGPQSLLYSGDFRLGPSATAAAAELPRADVFVMETTFGHPAYRMPPREQVVAELVKDLEHPTQICARQSSVKRRHIETRTESRLTRTQFRKLL